MRKINNLEDFKEVCFGMEDEVDSLYELVKDNLKYITEATSFYHDDRLLSVMSYHLPDIQKIVDMVNYDRISEDFSYCVLSLSKHDGKLPNNNNYYIRGCFIRDLEKVKVIERSKKLDQIINKETD